MAIVEEFPVLTKSEPISFGTLYPRKTRVASPFALADTTQLRNESILSSNPSKKKRPRKQHKKISNLQDDGSQVHSADELAHAFFEATGNSLRNPRDVQFGSVTSIWRQHNIVEHPTRAQVHSPIGVSVTRAAEDEGFVDGLTEPSSAASLRDGLRFSADATAKPCFPPGDHLPSLTGLGDSCHTLKSGHFSTTTKPATHFPSHVPTVPMVNHFDSCPRSRQDSSSENNSVVFGSPDLPRLWDSSGQETTKHNPSCRKELNHALETTSSTTNFGNIYASRSMRAILSQERGTGAVGDVDEDDLEGNDLLHLISNSLDRFNEIVHPHELNPGLNDDGLVLSADSTDLCSSGYGSFDHQPQQLLLQSGKFSLGELKSAVEDESNTNILPWLASSGTSRPNHGSTPPYFLAGDCDSSTKDALCTPIFPVADSTALCTNAGSSSSGGSSKAISPALFPNGSPSLYPDHISGNMGVTSDGTVGPGDNCPTISVTDSGSLSMLRHFCSAMSAPNPSGPSKMNEAVTEMASHSSPKPSAAEWCELLVHAVRTLQEGASRSTQLKEAILAAADHDELSKNGLVNLDAILNGLGLLGLNEAANTAAQWSQETKTSVTTPLNEPSSHRTVQSTTMPPSTLLGDDNFTVFNRTHRTTLPSTDVDQFRSQQQSKRTAASLCGRRSVLSACFPTNGSGSWESSATDVKLSNGGSCSGSNGCLPASFFDGYNQLSTEHTPARNATPFGPNHQSGRGQHRTTRRPNALSCSGNLLAPHNTSTSVSLAEPPLSYVLSNSNQTAPVPLGSATQFNSSRHGTSTTPFLLDSKSSNRPIVFHLQEFLRHGNNGGQKRMQCDHTMRLSNGGTNARGATSPSGHSAKTSSSGSGSSNSSTCGSTNPEHQSLDAGGKPVIAKWRRACSFYLRGHCKKEDCEFAHDLTKVTCKFWEMGECFKGPTCPFLHGYPPELLSSQEH